MTRQLLAAAAIGLAVLGPLPCPAQSPPTPSSTGLEPRLPQVPVVPPRVIESQEAAIRPEPRGPIAELLESVTTSDAVLEVIVGQGRIVATKEPIAQEGGIALVATGDPTVIDFEVAGPRLLRVLGTRVGVTDLSITTDAGQTYTFDIHVVYDLPLLTAYLRQIFPDAQIELRQLREHIVLEGQARSVEQISQIMQTLQAYLRSAQVARQVSGNQRGRPEVTPEGGPFEEPAGGEPRPNDMPVSDDPTGPTPIEVPEDRPRVHGTFVGPQIINLMRVPGVQQVMLKVQVAELNRTALREIGADLSIFDGGTGLKAFFLPDSPTTPLAIFDHADCEIMLSALRTNGVSNILAEPNLVAMNGQEASFQAGGEFPVPVAQPLGTTSIEYKRFGVLLNFVPTILDDETIRLRVAPEVSDIQQLIPIAGIVGEAPLVSTRNLNTTVELKQGQTLALAGLLQVQLDATTERIPWLGDLPYVGVLFSNTSHRRIEKELLVMVTPYLISPMDPCQVPPLPGSEITDPKCLEFFLMNRIEGRTGQPYRSPTDWDDPLYLRYQLELENDHFCGPTGYSE